MGSLAQTSKLLASLELQDKFTKPADKALGSLGKLEKGFATAAGNLAKVGAAVGVAATVALVGAVKAGVSSLSELSTLQQQTAAVIASTGAKAGVTAGQVRDLAESLENITTVDDKVIQGGENLLLTFTNIGADAFPRATKAMVDMAIALNQGKVEGLDLKSAALQIGKALNDPINGFTALKKAGVSLTDAQILQIKSLGVLSKEENKHYVALLKSDKAQAAAYKASVLGTKAVEAQKIILTELESEFGKAGEAAGKDFGSDMRRVDDAVESLQQSLAKGLMPVLTRAAKFLNDKLADPRTQAAIATLGAKLAEGGEKLLTFLEKVPWGQVADGLGKAKDAALGFVKVFMDLPDWLKTGLIGGFALNKLSGGAVLKIGVDLVKGAFDQIFAKGATPANPLFVKDISGGLGGGVPGSPRTGGGAKSGGGFLNTLTKLFAVGFVAEAATELGPIVTQFGIDLHKSTGLPTIKPDDLQWPFGPKNTPTIDFLKDTPLGDLSNILGGDAGKKADSSLVELIRQGDAQSALLRENGESADATARAIADAKAAQAIADSRIEGALRDNLQRPQVAPSVDVRITNNVSVRDVISGAITSTITSTGISSGSRLSRIAV